MKLKERFPEEDIILIDNNKETVNAVIYLFNILGIPIHEDTKEYDRSYPYLVWDSSSVSLTQCMKNIYPEEANSIEEFLSYFIEAPKNYEMEITKDYKAKISKEGIVVGCQIITFKIFDELYKLVQKYKKDNE